MRAKLHFRIFLLLLILLSLPCLARAEETSFRRVLTAEEVTDGTYILISSGQALGPVEEDGRVLPRSVTMEEGRPVPEEGILWQLQKVDGGLLLTDPAGKAFPAPSGSWAIRCENMLFRFSSGDSDLQLGFSEGAFTALTEEGAAFSLFRLTEEPSPAPEETPETPGLWFGLLHCHTANSDGTGTPETVFARAAEEMDFLFLTDHGDCLTDEEWQQEKTAAAQASTEGFAGARGFEMSWPEEKRLGHISLFGTETFLSWNADRYQAAGTGLEAFYTDLAGLSGAVGQFQHPGNTYGNFKSFAYDEGADRVIQLLEISCEGESFAGAYTAALDKGWHVAPTWGGNICDGGECGDGTGRTVILSPSLTPEALMDALRERHAYATADPDLGITYTLDGASMGDILPRRAVGPTAELDIHLSDPTDVSCGLVEVIGPGGAVLASAEVDSNPGRVTLSLPADKAYYFLRITQPDGDQALTAPVWVEQTEDLEITEFSCDTPVPVQGSAVNLTLKLHNGESAPLEVELVELLADGAAVATLSEPFRVATGTTVQLPLTYVHEKPGQSELTVRVSATLEGQARNLEARLTLSARRSDLVTGILVDGAHGNTGTGSLSELTRLSAEQNITVTVSDTVITEQMLDQCAILLVTAPESSLSDDFVEAAAEFVSSGGKLLLCASDPARAGELNRLLAAVGSTISLGRELPEHRPQEFNTADPLCAGINENQRFYMTGGCAVDPGNGTWLVRGQEILMAREAVGMGEVLVCGSLMVEDAALKAPASLWEEDFANRTIIQALLGISREPIPITDIRQVRAGVEGEVYRIQGYVTATTFHEELFLQDRTGGIGIVPFTGEKIPQGSAVEIIGILSLQDGAPVLNPISLELPDQSGYWYRPRSLTCRDAQSGTLYGGQLVQITGICTGRTLDSRGLLERFTLRDSTGRTVNVVVEEEIVSSATGRNDLHEIVAKGEEIWAIGILQTDENGKTFLRVRNCAEVVAVEPIPYTGDSLFAPMTALFLSAAALVMLRKRKQPK